MECVNCGGKTIVSNTRRYDGYRLRRRKCTECGLVFTSREVADEYAEELFREYNCISKFTIREYKKRCNK